jgi:NADH:ubiquinone oxidoreductase subunit 6 (subunit J)
VILLVSGVGIYVGLITQRQSPVRLLVCGLAVGCLVANRLWLISAPWSWNAMAFAGCGTVSLGGAIVLVTSRSSRLSVFGFVLTVTGIAGLAMAWDSASAFYAVVAGVLLPVGTVSAILATHIHSRRGSSELVEPLMACGMGCLLAGTLLSNIQLPHTFGRNRIVVEGAVLSSPTRALSDARASVDGDSRGTDATRADGQSRSDLIEFAKSLTEEHFVVLGLVAMLIAFGCSGVLLSDAGVKPNEEEYRV